MCKYPQTAAQATRSYLQTNALGQYNKDLAKLAHLSSVSLSMILWRIIMGIKVL